jgi:hypothetical protein
VSKETPSICLPHSSVCAWGTPHGISIQKNVSRRTEREGATPIETDVTAGRESQSTLGSCQSKPHRKRFELKNVATWKLWQIPRERACIAVKGIRLVCQAGGSIRCRLERRKTRTVTLKHRDRRARASSSHDSVPAMREGRESQKRKRKGAPCNALLHRTVSRHREKEPLQFVRKDTWDHPTTRARSARRGEGRWRRARKQGCACQRL